MALILVPFGSVLNGTKLRGFLDFFRGGFPADAFAGIEENFLTDGSHFAEDCLQSAVVADRCFEKISLGLRESDRDGLGFDFTSPAPVARMIRRNAAVSKPTQCG